jgi:hypothetical protein
MLQEYHLVFRARSPEMADKCAPVGDAWGDYFFQALSDEHAIKVVQRFLKLDSIGNKDAARGRQAMVLYRTIDLPQELL